MMSDIEGSQEINYFVHIFYLKTSSVIGC